MIFFHSYFFETYFIGNQERHIFCGVLAIQKFSFSKIKAYKGCCVVNYFLIQNLNKNNKDQVLIAYQETFSNSFKSTTNFKIFFFVKKNPYKI